MSTPRTAALAALVAAIGFAAIAPAVTAAPPTGNSSNSNAPKAHMQTGKQQNRQLDFRRDAMGRGNFQLVDLRCNDGAADRLDQRLDRIADRLELTDEQKALFETFQASALTAQTSFADACTAVRPVDATATPVDPIAGLESRLTIDQARITALSSVLPDLKAFYESLTDEQKASFSPAKMARDGQQWQRGPGRHDGAPGRQDDRPPMPPADAPANQDG